MIHDLRRLFRLTLLASLMPGPSLATAAFDPTALIFDLATTGPRISGTHEHQTAQAILLGAMGLVGLEEVEKLAPVGSGDWTHLRGELPGEGRTEVVLSAHYDTVQGSAGVLDNASGCAATLGAIADLSRTPRRNRVRLMLTDGEEDGAEGSQAWLSDLRSMDREGVLANLDVDTVGVPGPGAGILHLLTGWGADRRVLTPAWLVHATLQGAETAGFPLQVLDGRWSWFAQLGVRCAVPTRVSEGRRFLENGIPAVTVSDLSLTSPRGHHDRFGDDPSAVDTARLIAWTQVVAATLRQLDALADHPVGETEYLVLGGRVWVRRDLVWGGFVLWVLLVWRGLPGKWRQRDSSERRRRGRAYLPGFTFRMLFLLAVFLIPSFATLLLYPVAVLALAGSPGGQGARWIMSAVAVLPTLAFALWLTASQFAGWLVLDRAVLLPATLVLLTLATYCTWQLDEERV